MSETVNAVEAVLCVKDLVCKDRGEISKSGGLRGISFEVDKKGIYGILAPRGSGKSRLLNIIAGCEKKDGGEVLVCGIAVTEDSIEVKKRIGYAQKKNVFYPDMTVLETLGFAGETRGVESARLYRQIKEAMELVGLDAQKNRLVKNLTEFEVKKLSVAVSLLGNPDILIFDEPITSRMSLADREELEALILMLGKMKTVILSTDDYKTARSLCGDVLILSDGQVLAKGDFDVLEEKMRASGGGASLEAMYNSLALASEKKYSFVGNFEKGTERR